MALADPQSVTVGTATSLPRVITDNMAATYRNLDGSIVLDVSHQEVRNTKRLRTRVRVLRKKVTVNPLSDVKSEIDSAVTVVIDRNNAGWTETELIELITGVSGWLTAGTNANAKKVLGLES